MISTKTLINLLHKCGVPTNENVSTILTHLQKIAVLVSGNWTIKSDELYQDNTISSHFGLSFEVMRYLRDYIVIYYLNNILVVSQEIIIIYFNYYFRFTGWIQIKMSIVQTLENYLMLLQMK